MEGWDKGCTRMYTSTYLTRDMTLCHPKTQRDLIHALHHHNKCTTTSHMRVGPTHTGAHPHMRGCCVGVINLTFSKHNL
jgi:hypothetical protein